MKCLTSSLLFDPLLLWNRQIQRLENISIDANLQWAVNAFSRIDAQILPRQQSFEYITVIVLGSSHRDTEPFPVNQAVPIIGKSVSQLRRFGVAAGSDHDLVAVVRPAFRRDKELHRIAFP